MVVGMVLDARLGAVDGTGKTIGCGIAVGGRAWSNACAAGLRDARLAAASRGGIFCCCSGDGLLILAGVGKLGVLAAVAVEDAAARCKATIKTGSRCLELLELTNGASQTAAAAISTRCSAIAPSSATIALRGGFVAEIIGSERESQRESQRPNRPANMAAA
ncbi:MAG: hypothetical protein ABI476_04770 [Oxalobacteraceae bacterium]